MAQTVILEFQAENRLDVFWFAGRNDGYRDSAGVESVSQFLESLLVFFQHDMLFAVGSLYLDDVDTKDWILVENGCTWLAPIFLLEALPREVKSDPGV